MRSGRGSLTLRHVANWWALITHDVLATISYAHKLSATAAVSGPTVVRVYVALTSNLFLQNSPSRDLVAYTWAVRPGSILVCVSSLITEVCTLSQSASAGSHPTTMRDERPFTDGVQVHLLGLETHSPTIIRAYHNNKRLRVKRIKAQCCQCVCHVFLLLFSWAWQCTCAVPCG